MKQEGITLVELVIVIAIIGVLVMVTGFEINGWITRYRAETQVRGMYADMSSARQRAMHKNVQYLIVLSAKGYLICEDSNGNNSCDNPSETADSPVSRALSKDNLRFQINWNLSGSANTVVMDRKGMMSPVTPGGSSIWLVKPGAGPIWEPSEVDYDCLNIHETKLGMGKFNGIACQQK